MSIAEKLTEIAENVPKVYEAGKQAEYDRFWDSLQNSGNRTHYQYGFAGIGWNPTTLNPKYKVAPLNEQQGCSYIFSQCNRGAATPIDFSKIADKFDFSNGVYCPGIFADANIDNVYADLSMRT